MAATIETEAFIKKILWRNSGIVEKTRSRKHERVKAGKERWNANFGQMAGDGCTK
jgi:hypothetical protein